jgi:hypothetical protein
VSPVKYEGGFCIPENGILHRKHLVFLRSVRRLLVTASVGPS